MNRHSSSADEPETEERKCYQCGVLFMEMLRTDMDLALGLPDNQRVVALCIKCDPAAEDRDYRVVIRGVLGQ